MTLEAVEALERMAGEGERSGLLCELILERAAAGRPTLASLAREKPAVTRSQILGALDIHEGNAVKARACLEAGLDVSATEKSWRTAVDELALGEEIAKRWPARRGVSGRKP